jgi:hypothetical protein
MKAPQQKEKPPISGGASYISKNPIFYGKIRSTGQFHFRCCPADFLSTEGHANNTGGILTKGSTPPCRRHKGVNQIQ